MYFKRNQAGLKISYDGKTQYSPKNKLSSFDKVWYPHFFKAHLVYNLLIQHMIFGHCFK